MLYEVITALGFGVGMVEGVARRGARMAVLAAGRAVHRLVAADAVPVIGGLQARFVDVVLVDVRGLAVDLRRREGLGEVAVTAGHAGAGRAVGVTAGAAGVFGAGAGGVVMADRAVFAEVDMQLVA